MSPRVAVTARTVAAVVIAALAVFILGNAAQTPNVARPAAGAAGWARDLGPVELTVVVPSTPAAVLLGADGLLAGGPVLRHAGDRCLREGMPRARTAARLTPPV